MSAVHPSRRVLIEGHIIEALYEQAPLTATTIERRVARALAPAGSGGLSWPEWNFLQRELRRMERAGVVTRAGKEGRLILWKLSISELS